MERYVFRFSHISRFASGSIDTVLDSEKITRKELDRIRKDIINYIRSEGKTVDSDSFTITGWSRIYNE